MRAVLFGVSCLLLSGPVARTSAQVLFVSGAVKTAHEEPVRQAIVRVRNAGGDKTTDSGEFTIALPQQFKVGFPITFEVTGWVIIDPFVNDRGRIYLPAPEAETVLIKVVRQGDARLLSASSIQKLLEKKLSSLEPKPEDTGHTVSSPSRSTLPTSADHFILTADVRRTGVGGPHHSAGQDLSAFSWDGATQNVREDAASLGNRRDVEYLSLTSRQHGQARYPTAGIAPVEEDAASRDPAGVPTTFGLALIIGTASPNNISVNQSSVSERELKAHPKSETDEFLIQEAKELGFTVQELESAINQWTRTVKDAYARGLSALNAKRYPEAIKYFQESINSSGTNLFEKYLFLAKSEYSEGSYRDAEAALKKISASQSKDPIVLNYLGVVLLSQAKYVEAEPPLVQALAISRQVGDRAVEARTLINIGEVYRGLAQYDHALEVYQQALAISRQVGLRASEGTILNNIGEVYRNRGQYDQALSSYQQGMEASEEGGDLAGEARTLNNIGFVYRTLAQYPRALAYYQQALAINREAGDRAAEGDILANMGFVFRALGQNDEALEAYRQALAITKETGDRIAEVRILIFTGFVYQLLAQYGPALEVYQQALPVSREAHDRADEGTILNNIAGVYYMQHQYAPALEYYQQALAISREVGDRSGEAAGLNGIGAIYYDQGQYAQALQTHQRSLATSREIGSRKGEATSLANIGDIYYREGKYAQALESYQGALAANEQILDSHDLQLAKDLEHVARTLRALGWDREAKEFEDRAAAIRSGDR